ncbi:hypothetical protein MVES_000845 [Malassezia vespertilionis]|uniref:Uncharacterized protein n=1 Tax=Malassezia vespertilionis TaxID=2020962 RepID=A0A2N1JDX2_9BASI|nr:hypothetical protein MVES_000845 [Malassezia vespertilionis]
MSDTSPELSNVRAVLFDMDGLLIDSERIYTDVVNQILKPYGKEQTWEIKSKLMGKPERPATLVLLSEVWPPRPGNKEDEARGYSGECPFTLDDFLAERNAKLLPAFEKVPPMPGALRLVQHLAHHNIPICVATGSKRHNFNIKARANADIFAPFGERVVCGDDADLQRGKPSPDVFLLAAHRGLGIQDTPAGKEWLRTIRLPGEEHDGKFLGGEGQVLVFEDALAGLSAGMKA